MSIHKFKCTLITDVILNKKSASEGPQNTLDFIPGNNFLGIVASAMYPSEKFSSMDKLSVFHSGDVIFGDAHPAAYNSFRSVKIPAALYYPKLGKISDGCFVRYAYEDQPKETVQLKQCREGFYAFVNSCDENNHCAYPATVNKTFAIKSAYDRNLRRSKDEQMFGYESIVKGTVLYFEVLIGNKIKDEVEHSIIESLCGIKRIGRSKTAQYGLVDIEKTDYNETVSRAQQQDGYATVYADGRLIFIDSDGMPTLRPTAEDLGFGKDDEIDWRKTEIRTFQYSPWNAKRHTWDPDRCGIEKGSVFVVKCNKSPDKTGYVGNFNNEGFGRVIYNPDFLDYLNNPENPDNKKGVSIYSFKEPTTQPDNPAKDYIQLHSTRIDDFDNKFLEYVHNSAKHGQYSAEAYNRAEKFVNDNYGLFRLDEFSSQWGEIRKVAVNSNNLNDFRNALKDITDSGIAKDKWEEKKRAIILHTFVKTLTEENLWKETIVNICAEMAKKK